MNNRQIMLSILSISLLVNLSCKKPGIDKHQASFVNNGIITGSDLRTCVCCGGLMITFDSIPQPYAAPFKLIENAAGLGIGPNDKFPLYVQVVWSQDSMKGCNNIYISKISRK